MGWDGVPKVAFNYLYIPCGFKDKVFIYLFKYVVKNCHQIAMGFKF